MAEFAISPIPGICPEEASACRKKISTTTRPKPGIVEFDERTFSRRIAAAARQGHRERRRAYGAHGHFAAARRRPAVLGHGCDGEISQSALFRRRDRLGPLCLP